MNDNVGTSFEKLVSIMEKLRAPDGCPWDREQTHQTLKKYLLEETYEVLEAIDAGNLAELKTELGDLMLQIIFHAQIAAEEGVFNIKDVLEAISEKLIRRHPHVFGDVKVACAEEVLHRWEEIKACEPGYEKRKSILDGVPRTLPALARAMEISKRAAGAGFEWPDMHAVLEKVREEISELENEIQVGNKERIADEIGDLLFTVVNVARWAKVDPEDALRRMTDRFIERFKQIEEVAQSSGRQLSQMSIEEMDAIWDRAKNAT